MSAPAIRGVLTDADIEELRHRNEHRRQQAIAQLGPRWLLHAAHRPRRAADTPPLSRPQQALQLDGSA